MRVHEARLGREISDCRLVIRELESTRTTPLFPHLARVLQACCDDEVAHRDDARQRHQTGSGTDEGVGGLLAQLWGWVVARGSASAVAVARIV